MSATDAAVHRRWYAGMASTEDWWAVWLGLVMLAAGFASTWGWDLVGWMADYRTWVWGEFSWRAALATTGYDAWHPLASLGVTYLVFTALTGVGAWAMGLDLRRYLAGWTLLFALTWLVWIVGHEAHFAAPLNEFDDYGIEWGCPSAAASPTSSRSPSAS